MRSPKTPGASRPRGKARRREEGRKAARRRTEKGTGRSLTNGDGYGPHSTPSQRKAPKPGNDPKKVSPKARARQRTKVRKARESQAVPNVPVQQRGTEESKSFPRRMTIATRARKLTVVKDVEAPPEEETTRMTAMMAAMTTMMDLDGMGTNNQRKRPPPMIPPSNHPHQDRPSERTGCRRWVRHRPHRSSSNRHAQKEARQLGEASGQVTKAPVPGMKGKVPRPGSNGEVDVLRTHQPSNIIPET